MREKTRFRVGSLLGPGVSLESAAPVPDIESVVELMLTEILN